MDKDFLIFSKWRNFDKSGRTVCFWWWSRHSMCMRFGAKQVWLSGVNLPQCFNLNRLKTWHKLSNQNILPSNRFSHKENILGEHFSKNYLFWVFTYWIGKITSVNIQSLRIIYCTSFFWAFKITIVPYFWTETLSHKTRLRSEFPTPESYDGIVLIFFF